METSLSFVGHNVAVTGGCSGIGLAIVQILLALGGSVHVADIADHCPAEPTENEHLHFTGKCDVTRRAACKAFLDSIPGRLDGLVNCAGISKFEGKWSTDATFQDTMLVNVTGTWNMTTEALQRMSGQEDIEHRGPIKGAMRSVGQGSIVNIGSGASVRGLPGLAAYTASKHAILGLSRSWARDFPKLRVNVVAPGVTDTPLAHSMSTGAIGGGPAASAAALIPKGRMAYPTDIADAVVFLLSDWSSFITGQCLSVNGGAY